MDDADTNTDTDIVGTLAEHEGWPDTIRGCQQSTSNTLTELTVEGAHGAPWEKEEQTYI